MLPPPPPPVILVWQEMGVLGGRFLPRPLPPVSGRTGLGGALQSCPSPKPELDPTPRGPEPSLPCSLSPTPTPPWGPWQPSGSLQEQTVTE